MLYEEAKAPRLVASRVPEAANLDSTQAHVGHCVSHLDLWIALGAQRDSEAQAHNLHASQSGETTGPDRAALPLPARRTRAQLSSDRSGLPPPSSGRKLRRTWFCGEGGRGCVHYAALGCSGANPELVRASLRLAALDLHTLFYLSCFIRVSSCLSFNPSRSLRFPVLNSTKRSFCLGLFSRATPAKHHVKRPFRGTPSALLHALNTTAPIKRLPHIRYAS